MCGDGAGRTVEISAARTSACCCLGMLTSRLRCQHLRNMHTLRRAVQGVRHNLQGARWRSTFTGGVLHTGHGNGVTSTPGHTTTEVCPAPMRYLCATSAERCMTTGPCAASEEWLQGARLWRWGGIPTSNESRRPAPSMRRLADAIRTKTSELGAVLNYG